MASTVLQVIIKTIKEGTGDKQAAKDAKELKGALSDLGLGALGSVTALGALSGAIYGAANFTRQAMDATVQYAMEIKGLTAITGESAEEMSRVVQVMDDFQIKSDDLTKAQKELAKDGLNLSIETLAQLADQYVQLNSGVDKTNFLTEKLGKNGLKFADAFSKGGKALRDMAGAIDESLILNAEAIKQADEYRLALDALSDSWQAVQVSVGTVFLPVGTRLLDMLNDLLGITKDVAKNADIAWGIWDEGAEIIKRFLALRVEKGLEEQKGGFVMLSEAARESSDRLREAAAAEEDLAAQAKAASEANKSLLGLIQNLASAENNNIDTLKGLRDEQAKVAEELKNTPWWDTSAIEGHKEKLAEIDEKISETAENYQQKTNEIIYSNLLAKLSVDGLTDAEFAMAQEAGVGLGIFTKAQAETATKMNELTTAVADGRLAVDDLGAAIKMLPSGKSIDVILNILASGVDQIVGSTNRQSAANGATQQIRDSGGRGQPGEAYVIGTGAQPEVFIPDQPGSFYPAGSYSQAGGPGDWGGGSSEVVVRLADDASKMFKATVERIGRQRRD